MADWKKVFQDYLDASEDARANIASRAASSILGYCKSQGMSDNDAVGFIMHCFKLFTCGDPVTQRAEYNLFVRVTGSSMSYDAYFDLTNHGGDESYRASMDRLIDTMDDEAKGNVLILGLCIMTSDGKLTVSEQELFSRIAR